VTHRDAGDAIATSDAVITAAQVLDGLAGLLVESVGPSLNDPEQRAQKALLLRRTARALLEAHGQPREHLNFSAEWTGGLAHLLGVGLEPSPE
jgi:hypothetical protein